MDMGKFDIEDAICGDFVCSFNDTHSFQNAFRKKFNHIIAYHGTNLSGKELFDIQINGLKKTSKNLLLNKAKERFCVDSCKYSGEISNDIDKYFLENELYTNNEINFGLVKEDLIEHYHYVLFGAESLLPIADYLKRQYFKCFRKILVESGSHYIIKVVIPVDKTEDDWINGIFEYFHYDNFPISLVYHYDLPSDNIIEFEKVDRPNDTQGLILI